MDNAPVTGDARGQIPDGLQRAVSAWFSSAAVETVFGTPQNQTENLAFQWLSGRGKRWRPLLVAGAYAALASKAEQTAFSRDIIRLAMSVECLHKASLIHDDIEDEDETRNGEPTLHCRYGIPVALSLVVVFSTGWGCKYAADLVA